MTGVAAILRFPLQGIDDVDEESDIDSEEERINAIRDGREIESEAAPSEDDRSQSAVSMSDLESVLGLIPDADFDEEGSVMGSVDRRHEEEEMKEGEWRDEKNDY